MADGGKPDVSKTFFLQAATKTGKGKIENGKVQNTNNVFFGINNEGL